MGFIQRDIESIIRQVTSEYAGVLVTGPRQVGKTTLLREMDPARNYVTLDDLDERRLAKTDPALFLQLHPAPVLIDEVQYAPDLFSYIKINIDNGAAPGAYWLTGSQAFRLMELAQESLAGRVAILHMPSVSQHELFGSGPNMPFQMELKALQERAGTQTAANVMGMYERIFRGSMPGLASGKFSNRDIFYSSYVQSYIDRDVTEMVEGVDKLGFQDLIRAAACRCGQLLNVHDIAKDVGISDDTAKRWLAVLERSDIIYYLHPYSNNLLKRTIKTPKLYFFDTGLVAYLARYSNAEILASGAMAGAILENYVVNEIRKTYLNAGKEPYIYYYRDKDNNEVDLVLEQDGFVHPLEVKRSVSPSGTITSAFRVLDVGSVPRGVGGILCLRDELSAVDAQNYIVPIWMI